jgi:VIT1/CCC1 family predicted Fe2+/Mn2+ transporter
MSACPLLFGSAQTPGVEALNLDPELDSTLHGEPGMVHFGYNSLWGVLILAGDIWAILNILQSRASNAKKLIWTIAVVLLPVLGLLLWYFLGPRDRTA